MIRRIYAQDMDKYLKAQKVFVLYGPRQVGKTTLVRSYLASCNYKYRFDTGEDLEVRNLFSSQSLKEIKEYAQGYDLIVIDEAQYIENIGLGLKLLVDHVPQIRVIATGSASFELASKVGEPLTGRKVSRVLYPISQMELLGELNKYDLKARLAEYLIYGSYPEVITEATLTEKREILRELVNSYLLRDILQLERVKSPKILVDILKLLAFQIGKDVSLSEIASGVKVDYKTVARYLDILQKTFVIFAIPGFSRNMRKEVQKNKRYYFVDNGIRNALITNFNSLENRGDVGALWENFIVVEKLKINEYQRQFLNFYYWRTYAQEEIDLVSEGDGKLSAFEIKYSASKAKFPNTFKNAYPTSSLHVINKNNYLDFLS
ncbi:MAG: ATP-binding protein [Deltaproteobacteria bacterium]|nr:ATP-binding protein [Deltaproteobacteria bacterium]